MKKDRGMDIFEMQITLPENLSQRRPKPLASIPRPVTPLESQAFVHGTTGVADAESGPGTVAPPAPASPEAAARAEAASGPGRPAAPH